MAWNDNSYTEIVAKYPVIDNKPESVALAVWALDRNRDMSPQDWRDLSEKTGVKVAGRAVGSARQIVGMKPNSSSRRPARRTGPRRGRRRAQAVNTDSLGGVIAAIRETERERDEAVATLRTIRELAAVQWRRPARSLGSMPSGAAALRSHAVQGDTAGRARSTARCR